MYRSVVKQRLFVGWAPAEVDSHWLAGKVADYRRLPGLAPVRWLDPESWHLTLRFIGETDLGNQLGEALDRVLADQRSARVDFKSLGPFPTGRPSVLAFQGPIDPALSRLSARIEEAIDSVGVSPQRRPLNPHLSIARVKYWHAGPWPSQQCDLGFDIDRVALFRSETHPSGARYTALREWRLAGQDSTVG